HRHSAPRAALAQTPRRLGWSELAVALAVPDLVEGLLVEVAHPQLPRAAAARVDRAVEVDLDVSRGVAAEVAELAEDLGVRHLRELDVDHARRRIDAAHA